MTNIPYGTWNLRFVAVCSGLRRRHFHSTFWSTPLN